MDTSEERVRVLIVDDQKNWREVLCDMLGSDQYEIETAASYDEAKRKLRERAFHVLVSDQRLVDADDDNIQGILLLDELSALKDGAQAFIVTGYPTVEAVKKALMGRGAYDYLLKSPEEGGPFEIREYRARVKEAAEKAKGERSGESASAPSMSDLGIDLTYDQIVEVLFGKGAKPHGAQESIGKVWDWLWYPLVPLMRQMGKAWLSDSDRTCEILCWSREIGQTVLIRFGSKGAPLETGKMKWFDENRYEIDKREQSEAGSVVGVSYVINGMTFEDFADSVEED